MRVLMAMPGRFLLFVFIVWSGIQKTLTGLQGCHVFMDFTHFSLFLRYYYVYFRQWNWQKNSLIFTSYVLNRVNRWKITTNCWISKKFGKRWFSFNRNFRDRPFYSYLFCLLFAQEHKGSWRCRGPFLSPLNPQGSPNIEGLKKTKIPTLKKRHF